MKRIALLTLALVLIAVDSMAAGSIIKKWMGETTLAWTDGYTAAGATGDLAAAANVWQWYTATAAVDLETNGYEGAVVQVGCMSSGTTDTMEIGVFINLTADSTLFDYSPIYMYGIKPGIASTKMSTSFVVKDISRFGIGIRRTGTTNTFDWFIGYDAWYWYYN